MAVCDPSKAMHIWYLLWQELYFRMQEGAVCGRIPFDGIPSFLRSLAVVWPEAKEEEISVLFERAIIGTRLLVRDGNDYVSPRFIILNAKIGHQSKESKGGSAKWYKGKMKNLESEAFQQSLLIAPDKFVDETGQPLTGEETKRVVRLIKACDNALFQKDRGPEGFTEGLIQQARAVLKRYTDDEINVVCNNVAQKRGHPALNGVVTEKLFPIFGDISFQLN